MKKTIITLVLTCAFATPALLAQTANTTSAAPDRIDTLGENGAALGQLSDHRIIVDPGAADSGHEHYFHRGDEQV